MVLNSNNTSATHEAFIAEAVGYPDATWRVAVLHNDIYSSAHHALETTFFIALQPSTYETSFPAGKFG